MRRPVRMGHRVPTTQRSLTNTRSGETTGASTTAGTATTASVKEGKATAAGTTWRGNSGQHRGVCDHSGQPHGGRDHGGQQHIGLNRGGQRDGDREIGSRHHEGEWPAQRRLRPRPPPRWPARRCGGCTSSPADRTAAISAAAGAATLGAPKVGVGNGGVGNGGGGDGGCGDSGGSDDGDRHDGGGGGARCPGRRSDSERRSEAGTRSPSLAVELTARATTAYECQVAAA